MVKDKEVASKIKSQGRSCSWVIKQMPLSRPTFYTRLKTGEWTPEEYNTLRKIGVVR